MAQESKKIRVSSNKPKFDYFQKVWRLFGSIRVPAVVIGDPITRYGESDEFATILLFIGGLAALRLVPTYLLADVDPNDCADWVYDWQPSF